MRCQIAVTNIGEVLGNPVGGLKRSFAVDADLEKLLGAKQLAFHANVFQIDGGGLPRGALFNNMVVSGIDAWPDHAALRDLA